jgi:acyl-CoA dehydrogenase
VTKGTAARDYLATVAEVRQIARESVLPTTKGRAHAGVDRALVGVLSSSGLTPRLFPPAYGGSAGGVVSASALCAVREGLATESISAETAFALQGLGSYPILLSGSEDLRRRWLPGIARGDIVPAFALTEPDSGSDAAALSLRAEQDGSEFRLTGEKKWISNAPQADVYIVFARTTAALGARGVTAFVVPADAPGLSGSALNVLGGHPIGALHFDGVRVPASFVLGDVGGGFAVAMKTLNRFRPSVGAGAVGMAQAALDCAVVHATSRVAFGEPIGRFQAISHLIANMATRLEAARLLVTEAAAANDEERSDLAKLAAMSKLFATEAAQYVIDSAMQVLGAAGLEEGHLLAELYAGVRALRIYEGTSEIQRTIIARQLLPLK